MVFQSEKTENGQKKKTPEETALCRRLKRLCFTFLHYTLEPAYVNPFLYTIIHFPFSASRPVQDRDEILSFCMRAGIRFT